MHLHVLESAMTRTDDYRDIIAELNLALAGLSRAQILRLLLRHLVALKPRAVDTEMLSDRQRADIGLPPARKLPDHIAFAAYLQGLKHW